MMYRSLTTTALPRPRLGTRRRTRIAAILEGLRMRRPPVDEPEVMTTAELAECGCPEWCHRDHQNE
jgi:hypothetical protein